ncbi:MAG: L-aspartate oxidase [Actinobacteria bacterium]|nr:L-aspartate oxidase [Actinomycetota bacterium]
MKPDYLVNFDTRQLPQDYWDYVIIGSGIAGLYAAYMASSIGKKVVVITKQAVDNSNTDKAQGGIAAALGTSDSPELHYDDTLMAGAGLCDESAVKILVNEGPGRVRELIEIGARFDQKGGELALTKEGAHSRRRILHASGDATGAEIQRALASRIREDKNVLVLENHQAVDLLVHDDTCYGILVYDRSAEGLHVYRGAGVILATGGLGMLYEHNTNPEVATGDGIAIAYRAGAEVMDMEFIQFHPTVLSLPGAPRFLISEAVRGEGAYLRNRYGDRFMVRCHDLAELAPRNVVVRAILSEMANTASEKVFLDLSHMSPDLVRERFPNILKTCAKYGLDITRDPVPVAPAAHYMMGGVKTNLNGETSIRGLYACGEAACLGVHGANRLASNSLLDGLVFGHRIVECVKKYKIGRPKKQIEFACDWLDSGPVGYNKIRTGLRTVMNQNVGPVRTGEGLKKAIEFFNKYSYINKHEATSPPDMEVRNMLEVGSLIAESALMRTESRGGHYRLDYPDSRDSWRKHLILRK